MSENSKINWTERTWNVTGGCEKVSAGCLHCWAEQLTATRFKKNPRYCGLVKYGNKPKAKGRWSGKIKLFEDRLEQPLHWRDPALIFVNSQSDLFHEKVPFEFIDKVMAVISLCPQHCFQLLTKRANRAAKYFKVMYSGKRKLGDALRQMGIDSFVHRLMIAGAFGAKGGEEETYNPPYQPFPNLHIGVTCENQKTRDERVPILLEIPAAVRFISCEPLLSFMCLNKYFWRPIIETSHNDPLGEVVGHEPMKNKPDWVIVGCESGSNRRPCKIEWVRSIVEQCKAAGVKIFIKQLEMWGPNRKHLYETAQQAKLHLGEIKMKSFVTHELKDFPKDSQVRQYPKG